MPKLDDSTPMNRPFSAGDILTERRRDERQVKPVDKALDLPEAWGAMFFITEEENRQHTLESAVNFHPD